MGMKYKKLKLMLILCVCFLVNNSNIDTALAIAMDDDVNITEDSEVTVPEKTDKENEENSTTEDETTEGETTEDETAENVTTEDKTNNSKRVTSISIDNMNKYNGMDKTYQEGYIPTISNGKAIIILPIISNGEIKNNVLKSTINLGDTYTMPFVYKNYQKDIVLQQHKVNDSKDIVDCYLVVYELDLKADRVNGIYPVKINIKGEDTNNNIINEEVITYVTITDGKNPDEDSEVVEPENTPSFIPKVMVDSYKCSQTPVVAGTEVVVNITLINTSQSSPVLNMTVTAEAPNEYLTLLNETDTIYIYSIGIGEKYTVSFKYKVAPLTPAGQYDIGLAMDYADEDGGCHSSFGNAKLNVEQIFRVEFDPVIIADELEVADVVEVNVNGINLGKSKVYNARANIEMEGLRPEGTIFIGDIEPGNMKSASTEASVTSLSGASSYGTTQGTITFTYEDENGNEYKMTQELSTKIVSPFTNIRDVEEEDKPIQWWIIMGIIVLVLVCFGITQVATYIRRKNDEKM